MPYAGGNVASTVERKLAVKYEELKHALELLTKVLVNPSIEPIRREQLRRAKRQLEEVLSSGKLDRPRVFRVIELLATLLLENAKSDATLR